MIRSRLLIPSIVMLAQVGCRSAKGAGKGAGVQLAAVWVTCTGSERVDASWVSSSYAAGDDGPHSFSRSLILAAQ